MDDDYEEYEEYEEDYIGNAYAGEYMPYGTEPISKPKAIKNLKLGQKGKDLYFAKIENLTEKKAFKCLNTIIRDEKNAEILFYNASYDPNCECLTISANGKISLKKWKKKEATSTYHKVDNKLYDDVEALIRNEVIPEENTISFARVLAYNNELYNMFLTAAERIGKRAKKKIADRYTVEGDVELQYIMQNNLFSVSGNIDGKNKNLNYYFDGKDWVVLEEDHSKKIGFAPVTSRVDIAFNNELGKLLKRDFNAMKKHFDDHEFFLTTYQNYIKSSNTGFMLNINWAGTELIIPDRHEHDNYKANGQYYDNSPTRPFSFKFDQVDYIIRVNDENKKTENNKQLNMEYFFTDQIIAPTLMNNIYFRLDDMPYWMQELERNNPELNNEEKVKIHV